MKKTPMLAALLVLTLALFTGCGCRKSKPAATTRPTTVPTVATTAPTTAATTVPTAPATDATIEDGNGPLPTDATLTTEDPAVTDGTAGDQARTMPDTGMLPRGSGIG